MTDAIKKREETTVFYVTRMTATCLVMVYPRAGRERKKWKETKATGATGSHWRGKH